MTEIKMLKDIIQKDLDETNEKIDDYTNNEELSEDHPYHNVCVMKRNGMVDMKMYMEKILNLITDYVEVN